MQDIYWGGEPILIQVWGAATAAPAAKLLVMSDSWDPIDSSPPGSSVHGILWDPPGKNTGVGSHSLLQGVFRIQGLPLGTYNMFKRIFKWQCKVVETETQSVSSMQFRQIVHKLNQYRKSGLKTSHTPNRGKIKYVVKRLKSQEWVGKQKTLESRVCSSRMRGL